MRRRLYNRMSILTLDVIAEVEMRPAIWMAGTPGYTNRAEKTEAWLSVVRALVEGYDEMDVAVQNEIHKDVQSRWKSAKDYFLKGVKKWERSGSLPDEYNKIPYHSELHFLMPNRCLRTYYSIGEKKDLRSSWKAMVLFCCLPLGHARRDQVVNRYTGPFLSMSSAELCMRPTNGNNGQPGLDHQVLAVQVVDEEELAGPSAAYVKEEEIVVPVSSHPAAGTTSAGLTGGVNSTTPPASGVSSPESDFVPPSSPTRPPPAQRRRRSLRLADRKLEVESRAQSLMQRVDGNDDSAHFGYGMGSLCRQMPLIRRQHFKAYCQVVAAAFLSSGPLTPIEDMIMHFQTVSGQRPPAPPANPNNMATQTDPPAPPPILPQ